MQRDAGARASSAVLGRHSAPQMPEILTKYYEAMAGTLGPMHWWPADSAFEVIVGAILTQNTAWTNVKIALANLRREKLFSPQAIEKVSEAKLARLIRSSGYFRQKARKLKEFTRFLRREYGGSLGKMISAETAELRVKLLDVHGIGPETADSILLYACRHPVFVVDAYTKRILSRHGLAAANASYEDVQRLFTENLPADTQLFNEYHALIVNVAKKWCRKSEPLCNECPLGGLLPPSKLADAGTAKLST